MPQIQQVSLFGQDSEESLEIARAAEVLRVSTASIRNWIKTGYLKKVGPNTISLNSFDNFKEEVIGKEKLTQRANKSRKDNHDHEHLTKAINLALNENSHADISLSDLYEGSLSESYKNKEGIFYTPLSVARTFFEYLPDDCSNLTFCDPCCGTGNFLIAAIEKGFHPSNVFGFEQAFRGQSYGLDIGYRPFDALNISLTPNYSITKRVLQYLNTETVNAEDAYIFGRLHQKTLDLTLRIDYTISPELTIQYYGAPFISGVDYSRPKKITDPLAEVLRDRYSLDVSFSEEDYVNDYDFNFRQFRSNLVVRWEYQPGSLLYLVWTQGRTGSAETGRFSYGRDLRGLYDIYPENVFLVKLSYRFIR